MLNPGRRVRLKEICGLMYEPQKTGQTNFRHHRVGISTYIDALRCDVHHTSSDLNFAFAFGAPALGSQSVGAVRGPADKSVVAHGRHDLRDVAQRTAAPQQSGSLRASDRTEPREEVR
jgi:hypothetical protein